MMQDAEVARMQELYRRQQAMSPEDMAKRQEAMRYGMSNAYPENMILRGDALRNAYYTRQDVEESKEPAKPTLWQKLKRLLTRSQSV